MKNRFIIIIVIGNVFLTNVFAQSYKSEFNKTVDTINSIIKRNPLAYYLPEKQYGAFVKKITVSKQGIITFTDSIPASKIIADKLISDCCSQKKARTLDLSEIKKWNIYFPIAYLIDDNKKTFAKFIGFKKIDLEKLKEQMEKLSGFCRVK